MRPDGEAGSTEIRFYGQDKELGLYSECDRKLLEGFKQGREL